MPLNKNYNIFKPAGTIHVSLKISLQYNTLQLTAKYQGTNQQMESVEG